MTGSCPKKPPIEGLGLGSDGNKRGSVYQQIVDSGQWYAMYPREDIGERCGASDDDF